ncbi:15394_t:CDS:2, partial [Gigaspora rosea]
AGFHIQMILSRWFTDEQKENDPPIESLYFTKMEFENQSNLELALVSNTSTIPKTY